MAFRWAVVIRGISRPVVVDEISSIALLSGNEPVALIPIFCALSVPTKSNKIATGKIFHLYKILDERMEIALTKVFDLL